MANRLERMHNKIGAWGIAGLIVGVLGAIASIILLPPLGIVYTIVIAVGGPSIGAALGIGAGLAHDYVVEGNEVETGSTNESNSGENKGTRIDQEKGYSLGESHNDQSRVGSVSSSSSGLYDEHFYDSDTEAKVRNYEHSFVDGSPQFEIESSVKKGTLITNKTLPQVTPKDEKILIQVTPAAPIGVSKDSGETKLARTKRTSSWTAKVTEFFKGTGNSLNRSRSYSAIPPGQRIQTDISKKVGLKDLQGGKSATAVNGNALKRANRGKSTPDTRISLPTKGSATEPLKRKDSKAVLPLSQNSFSVMTGKQPKKEPINLTNLSMKN